jgi:hypothetical protein
VEIVYGDEIEFIVYRRIFAAQTSRPDPKRKERAGAEPEPLPTSESGRHNQTLSRDRSNTSHRPTSFPLPYPKGEREKSQISFKTIISSAVRSQSLQPYQWFDHLVVSHRRLVEERCPRPRGGLLRVFSHLLAALVWTIT